MSEGEERLSEGEVERFAKSLDEWSGSLDASEQALLQIVLERAAGADLESAEDVDLAFPASGNLSDVVAPFLRDIVSSGALGVRSGGEGTEGIPDLEAREREAEGVVGGKPKPYVRGGEMWVRGA